MRGRPAPEDPAAQEAESEDVADIGADTVRGMCPAGNCFVCGCDKSPDDFSLDDGPRGQGGFSTFGNNADLWVAKTPSLTKSLIPASLSST
jgi:hypothetical protein